MYRDNKHALTLCPIYYYVRYIVYTIPVHVICCCCRRRSGAVYCVYLAVH